MHVPKHPLYFYFSAGFDDALHYQNNWWLTEDNHNPLLITVVCTMSVYMSVKLHCNKCSLLLWKYLSNETEHYIFLQPNDHKWWPEGRSRIHWCVMLARSVWSPWSKEVGRVPNNATIPCDWVPAVWYNYKQTWCLLIGDWRRKNTKRKSFLKWSLTWSFEFKFRKLSVNLFNPAVWLNVQPLPLLLFFICVNGSVSKF